MSLRFILLTFIFIVLMFNSVRRPWVGLLTWSWIGYMNPHRMAYGYALEFPYVLIAACVTVFAWLISKEPKRFVWTRETILEIVFTLWFSFTTLFALSRFASDYWDRTIKVQIMIFMTYFIMNNRFRLNALVWTIVASIGFFGVKGGIWAFLTGSTNAVRGPADSFLDGNNEIALALVMVLPLMRYLQNQAEDWRLRWGLAGAQILTVLAILTTYSRGGFIALCGVGFLLWLKSRHKLALATALLIVVPPLILFMPGKWKDRMSTIQNTDTEQLDDSARGRLNVWHFAWNLVQDRPITGGGFHVFLDRDTFRRYAPSPEMFHDAHSIYFEILGEQGFPGLAIFLTLGVFSWMSGRWAIQASRSLPEVTWASEMAAAAQVGLAGYALGGVFIGLAYFDLPYHLMAIIVMCKVIVKQEQRLLQDDSDIRIVSTDLVIGQEA